MTKYAVIEVNETVKKTYVFEMEEDENPYSYYTESVLYKDPTMIRKDYVGESLCGAFVADEEYVNKKRKDTIDSMSDDELIEHVLNRLKYGTENY